MGVVKNNAMMASVTGTVGQVYFRIVRGKQIVCNLPGKGRKFTPAQLANQKRFGKVSRKAKRILENNPELKAQYQSQVDNQKFTAHMVAQSEMMKKLKD